MNMELRHRRILVLGMGLTGFSMLRYLLRRGAQVVIVDTRSHPPFLEKIANFYPQVEIHCGALRDTLFEHIDGIAISPGVDKRQPYIRQAEANGVPLFGDIELFAQALPEQQKVLAVTGTNGKTTTTELTRTLCETAGYSAVAAGNIGEPVLDVLECFEGGASFPDVLVLELSSYQLETTHSLSPLAATVLNISENHLDRYSDIAAYVEAKTHIFDRTETQILNINDPHVRAMKRADKQIQYFGIADHEHENIEQPFWCLREHQGASWLCRNEQPLLEANRLTLVGRHNALNALAALALTSMVVGQEDINENVLNALQHFHGLPHRMEDVGTVHGVRYINDSKATTVTATSAALTGMNAPVILIAGGDGKGQNFAPLTDTVAQHCRAILLIGRDASLLNDTLRAHGDKLLVENCETLTNAMQRAHALAQAGDIVLLSPACASLDQFDNYQARGEAFAAIVTQFAEEEM